MINVKNTNLLDTINIRTITLKDTDSRHKFFVELSMAQTGMVHTQSEIELHNHETQEKIADFVRYEKGIWLIALNEHNDIIGEVDIIRKNLSRVKHNGHLSIGVLPPYQSRGVGKALMKHALLKAKEHGLLRIELSVFKSNEKAQHLYKNFGFQIEGIRHNFLRLHNNTFESDIIMAKYFF